jgi:hypothetical protein
MFFEGFRTIEGGVYHYQCSEFSTSNEIKTVFDNAIQRQRKWRSSSVGTGVKRSAVSVPLTCAKQSYRPVGNSVMK